MSSKLKLAIIVITACALSLAFGVLYAKLIMHLVSLLFASEFGIFLARNILELLLICCGVMLYMKLIKKYFTFDLFLRLISQKKQQIHLRKNDV